MHSANTQRNGWRHPAVRVSEAQSESLITPSLTPPGDDQTDAQPMDVPKELKMENRLAATTYAVSQTACFPLKSIATSAVPIDARFPDARDREKRGPDAAIMWNVNLLAVNVIALLSGTRDGIMRIITTARPVSDILPRREIFRHADRSR